MATRQELQIVINAEDNTKGAFGAVNKSLANIGKVALGVAAGGVAAVGAGIGLLASKAIPAASDLNEALNAVNVVFEENANQIIEWGKTAAETAGLSQAEFAGMAAQTGAMLQNFGLDANTAADATIDLAQRAADMASIFNTDVNEALVAIQAGLRGEADPLERFGVSLSAAAVKAKALEMGLADTTGELDNAALTQARLALLFEQTDKIAGDFVNTSDQLANASRVQSARWENFLAEVGQRFLPIMERFQGIFMDIAERVFPIVEQALEAIMPTVEGIADAFADFIGRISEGEDIWGSFIRLLWDIGAAFGLSHEAMNPFLQGINNIKETISEFMTNTLIPFVQEHWEALKAGLIAVGAIIAGATILSGILAIAGAIAALVNPITLIIGVIALLGVAWSENWGGIQEKTQSVITFLQGLIQSALAAIQAFWAQHGAEIMQIVQMAWLAIQSIIQSVSQIITTVIQAATQFIQEIWAKHGEQIINLLRTAWNMIVTIIKSVIVIIQNVFKAFAALLKGDWEGLSQALQTIWDALWAAIQSIFATAKALLETTFGILGTVLTNIWENLKLALIDLWETGWTAIKEYFITKKAEILTTIGEFVAGIIRTITETDWVQLGKDIIQSMADGIGLMGDVIWNAAKKMAKKAWDAIKDFFGIGSPSKLMIAAGGDVATGFAVGFKNEMPYVEEAMRKAAEGLYAAFGSAQLAGSADVLDVWNRMWQELSRASDETLRELGAEYGDFFDIMTDSFRDGYAFIGGEWVIWNEGLLQNSESTLRRLDIAYSDGLRVLTDDFMGFFNNNIDAYRNWTNQANDIWWDAGDNMASIWNWHMDVINDATANGMDGVTSTIQDGANNVNNILNDTLSNITNFWANAGSIFGGPNPINNFLPNWNGPPPLGPAPTSMLPIYDPDTGTYSLPPGHPLNPLPPGGGGGGNVFESNYLTINTNAPIELSERDLEVLKSWARG